LLEPAKLVDAVYQSVIASGLFEGPDIKVRAFSYYHHQTGNKKENFIHVSLRILSGRTDEQKTSLSWGVLEKLRSFQFNKISLTVEVLDIHRHSYAKHIEQAQN
jgi:5-carboxymethyl-2-hydroxymuconate isomerase